MTESDWFAGAACRGVDPALFFPERSDAGAPERVVKELCRTCPVAGPCLELGMRQEYGVWGGTTEKERRAIARARRRWGAA